MMEEGNNKNSIYLFPSFLLSVLLVENTPSGLCSTDETVSYVETNFNFFSNQAQIVSIRKIKTLANVHVTRKISLERNWKQS